MASPSSPGPPSASEPAYVRLLLPREHGTYGQLLFPLGTVLLIGDHAAAALATATACVMAFIAHEAVLILLGHRGGRVARERHEDAIRWLVGCGALTVASGVSAIALMRPAARVSLAIPVTMALSLIPFIWTRTEHSTAGEIMAAIGLSSCCVPVALAGGISLQRALTCWLVFGLAFVVATVAVRSVIARLKDSTRSSDARNAAAAHRRIAPTGILLAIASLAFLLGSGDAGWLPWVASLAVLPVCALAAALSLFPPHPRHLRTVGWLLVTATAATAAILAVALA